MIFEQSERAGPPKPGQKEKVVARPDPEILKLARPEN